MLEMSVPVALDLLWIPVPVSASLHPTKNRHPVGFRPWTVAAAAAGVPARDIPAAGAVILVNDSLSDMVGPYRRKNEPPPRHRPTCTTSTCTTSLPLDFGSAVLIVSNWGRGEGLDSLAVLTCRRFAGINAARNPGRLGVNRLMVRALSKKG